MYTHQNVLKTMLGPTELSPLCQSSFFNRIFSVKYKVLGSYKPSSVTTLTQKALACEQSRWCSCERSVIQNPQQTVVITAGKKGFSSSLGIIALCNTICNNTRAEQATAPLSLLVSSVFLTSLHIVFSTSFRLTSAITSMSHLPSYSTI